MAQAWHWGDVSSTDRARLHIRGRSIHLMHCPCPPHRRRVSGASSMACGPGRRHDMRVRRLCSQPPPMHSQAAWSWCRRAATHPAPCPPPCAAPAIPLRRASHPSARPCACRSSCGTARRNLQRLLMRRHRLPQPAARAGLRGGWGRRWGAPASGATGQAWWGRSGSLPPAAVCRLATASCPCACARHHRPAAEQQLPNNGGAGGREKSRATGKVQVVARGGGEGRRGQGVHKMG